MRNFLSILNIDFLAGKGSSKNWKMLLFISLLLMTSIYSSHRADQKIFLITKLNKEVNTLNGISVSTKVDLMNLKMETKIMIYPQERIDTSLGERVALGLRLWRSS